MKTKGKHLLIGSLLVAASVTFGGCTVSSDNKRSVFEDIQMIGCDLNELQQTEGRLYVNCRGSK